MFCQKCGTKNPDAGKFCRNCGTDLNPTSNDLLENFNSQFRKFKNGNLENYSRKFKNGNLDKRNQSGMMSPVDPLQLRDKKGKPLHWEGAITKLFTGIAFAVISIVLAFSAMGNGWWFWMLIPAFSCIGAGFAQIIQLRKNEKNMISAVPQETQNVLRENIQNELPSSKNDYIYPDSRYKTGDLAPPSVVENTTRHLGMNTEGETMTFPKTENKSN